VRLVRLATCAGAAAATFALAACGASEEDTWPGPPAAGPDGSVAVEGFAAHQESVDEPWEASTVLTAAEFLKLGERDAANTSIRAAPAPDGTGSERITVVLDGLLDESVFAERWVLEFEPVGDGFQLASAERTQRCQTGRGHADFSAEPCS
jgi:hypothetical protein